MNPCCEFAHYYLGCRYRFTWPDGTFVEEMIDAILHSPHLCGFDISVNAVVSNDVNDNWFEIDDFRNDGNFQLFLTDTGDMSKVQMKEYKDLCFKIVDLHNNESIVRYADTPLSIDYLFRNGIDAFELIENGHALDLKTLTT